MSSITTIYVVRHAHAHWTPDDARPLSHRGRADARTLAALLSDRPIVAIYSSPSRRARETVAPLARRLQLTASVIPDFRERELAPVPAARFESVVAETWRSPDRALPGGEPNSAAAARGVAALLSVRARHVDEQTLVSTHGTLLALMVNALDPRYGFEFWRQMTFPDVYQLEFSGDQLVRLINLWSPRLTPRKFKDSKTSSSKHTKHTKHTR
jgi:2,3-bisphosphoglycerate-dependent phosphoglycerate mutase